MTRIAILGATSQIAKDLIIGLAEMADCRLHLYARRTDELEMWLGQNGLAGRFMIEGYAGFPTNEYDAVINFVGAGDPARISVMGKEIFEVTLRFDEMVLDYLKTHPRCRYLFLSSGAAYGSDFEKPVTLETAATIKINELSPHEWYGVAKLHAECRHRALPDLPIIDIRVFNYFSRTQDINARFLITDILRAIRNGTELQTSADFIVRDYLHPSDFYHLVMALLSSPATNAVVDCYSKASVDKPTLLDAMQRQFGLRYEVMGASSGVNATGCKPHYYSLNRRAADFGYIPALSSLEGVLQETSAMLQG
jgi:nucleoside-diphosphate-sugar epimerase